MRRLDRAGIFKAQPKSWGLRKSERSQAVAITIEYQILEQLDGAEWESWSDYEPHSIHGDHWVIKGDGALNSTQVESLAQALGWAGDLRAVTGDPPDVVVQITVREEEYDGKVRLKVGWVNPGDYAPTPQTESAESVAALQSRYGSLLRAAAGVAAKPTPKPAPRSAPKPAPKAAAVAAGDDTPPTEDDIPF